MDPPALPPTHPPGRTNNGRANRESVESGHRKCREYKILASSFGSACLWMLVLLGHGTFMVLLHMSWRLKLRQRYPRPIFSSHPHPEKAFLVSVFVCACVEMGRVFTKKRKAPAGGRYSSVLRLQAL